MNKRMLVTIVVVSCVLMLSGCQHSYAKPNSKAKEIVVLCPKIFASVINEIKPSFEKENPPYTIRVESDLVSHMLQDILQGKKQGDIFLSLGDVEIARLSEKGLIKAGRGKAFAETSLAALAPLENPLGISRLKDFVDPRIRRIAIPNPRFNSAGVAFIEASKTIGIYEDVKDRLLFSPGPNSSTKFMEQGKADVSITHNRCYYGHAKVNTLVEFVPTNLHKPIVCKAVVLKYSKRPDLAEKFIGLLLITENQKRFEKAHFKKVMSYSR